MKWNQTDGSFIKYASGWMEARLCLSGYERLTRQRWTNAAIEWVSERMSQLNEKNTIDASLFGCGISEKSGDKLKN